MNPFVRVVIFLLLIACLVFVTWELINDAPDVPSTPKLRRAERLLWLVLLIYQIVVLWTWP